jgi:ERF superfamily
MNEIALAKDETAATEPSAPALPAVGDRHARATAERKPRKQSTESIVNIATAISGITSECGVIAKQGYNKFHNYKFAQMQDVLQKLTPLIAKHGLIIVQTETGRNMLDDGRAVAVEYEFTLAHTSGEMWPDRPRQTGLCRARDSKGGFDDKCFNKAHTAARKYFLLALFQIATGDEDDADTEQSYTASPPPRPPARHAAAAATPVPADQPAAAARASTPAAAGAGFFTSAASIPTWEEYVDRWDAMLRDDDATAETLRETWMSEHHRNLRREILWPDDGRDPDPLEVLRQRVIDKIAALKALTK